jgi:hypothetical protein
MIGLQLSLPVASTPACIWDSGLDCISPLVHLTYYAKNKGQMSAQIPYRTDGGFVK